MQQSLISLDHQSMMIIWNRKYCKVQLIPEATLEVLPQTEEAEAVEVVEEGDRTELEVAEEQEDLEEIGETLEDCFD